MSSDLQPVPIRAGTRLRSLIVTHRSSDLQPVPIRAGTRLKPVSLTTLVSIPRSVTYTGQAHAKAGIRQVPKDAQSPVQYVGQSTGW